MLAALPRSVPARDRRVGRCQVADDRLARSAGWAVLLPAHAALGRHRLGRALLDRDHVPLHAPRRAARRGRAAAGRSALRRAGLPHRGGALRDRRPTRWCAPPWPPPTASTIPDRILKLRQLVEAYPEDPVYRFLLAGLYKNGRYFEEAFAEYKAALELDPALEEAHINIGNIFYTTGQYAEAIANYRRALEVDPGSILAYFNMHLAQSESFRFKEAEDSLNRAREIDAPSVGRDALRGRLARRRAGGAWTRRCRLGSVWQAALGGGDPRATAGHRRSATASPGSAGSSSTRSALVAAAGAARLRPGARWSAGGDAAARRCIRCGRPFCHYCKSGREGREYCSQCLHLYVLGDGLAPETKTRKLYEVERHERCTRRGAAAGLRVAARARRSCCAGGPAWGVLLLLAWLAALVAWQPGDPAAAGTARRDSNLRLELLEAGRRAGDLRARPARPAGARSRCR